jgi:thiol-disulfide isomerase/thioredoxin
MVGLMAAALASGALPPVSEKSLPSILKSHEGSVLVLNFWATWCGPCREEFPYLVRLHRELGNRGVVVVSISMDEPEDAQAAVSFLAGQGAEFPSYIRNFESFPDFVDVVDPAWSGALPATFVFRRDGTLDQRFLGAVTWEQLFGAVSPLVGQ